MNDAVRELTPEDAAQILGWRYPAPYHIYDLAPVGTPESEIQETIDFLVDPANGYFAVDDGSGQLLGFCCFGFEGQVPGYDYSRQEALDIGYSMDPARTGQGLGAGFLRAILVFGRTRYQPTHFRATVAAFNLRSSRLCISCGFEPVARFISETDTPRAFDVLLRPA